MKSLPSTQCLSKLSCQSEPVQSSFRELYLLHSLVPEGMLWLLFFFSGTFSISKGSSSTALLHSSSTSGNWPSLVLFLSSANRFPLPFIAEQYHSLLLMIYLPEDSLMDTFDVYNTGELNSPIVHVYFPQLTQSSNYGQRLFFPPLTKSLIDVQPQIKSHNTLATTKEAQLQSVSSDVVKVSSQATEAKS